MVFSHLIQPLTSAHSEVGANLSRIQMTRKFIVDRLKEQGQDVLLDQALPDVAKKLIKIPGDLVMLPQRRSHEGRIITIQLSVIVRDSFRPVLFDGKRILMRRRNRFDLHLTPTIHRT